MKAKIIINPSSGKQVVQKNLPDIVSSLVLNNIVNATDVTYTQKKNDAFEAAKRMKKGEYDLVIVAGGDGTLNEVVNGVIVGKNATPIAILPAGTVNDFSTFIGVPRETSEFCQMIKDRNIIPTDVGKIDDRYFVNVAAGGLMTDIGYKVSVDAKTVMGKFAYYAQGMIEFPQQMFKSININIDSDEIKLRNKESLMFIIANSPSVGGFKKLAPKAKLNDGKLDVFVVHKTDFTQVVPLFVQILKGEHTSSNNITYFQTNKVNISCTNFGDICIDIDGEQGEKLPVTIEAIREAVSFFVPK